jgi:hypothetical protein
MLASSTVWVATPNRLLLTLFLDLRLASSLAEFSSVFRLGLERGEDDAPRAGWG